jgi:hypothetical protein
VVPALGGGSEGRSSSKSLPVLIAAARRWRRACRRPGLAHRITRLGQARSACCHWAAERAGCRRAPRRSQPFHEAGHAHEKKTLNQLLRPERRNYSVSMLTRSSFQRPSEGVSNCGDCATALFKDSAIAQSHLIFMLLGTRSMAHERALALGPPHCGKSLQSLITIMTVEPIATTTGQTNGNSSSRPIRTARTRRVLFTCAKRQPATPIGNLRLAPSSSGLIFKRKRGPDMANSVFHRSR